MHDSKVFIMGTGFASGEDRAMNAVKMALQSPLLDNNDIYGTKNILLNIISGTEEITIGEIGQIIEYLQREAGQEADIIWGNGYDEAIGDKICVTILCTGFKNAPTVNQPKEKTESSFRKYPVQEAVQEEPVMEETVAEEPLQRTFELELDPGYQDENPQGTKITRKPEERPVQKQQAKKVKEPGQSDSGGESLDNWFIRKFGRLFEDDDQQFSK
jgi:cell division protein FtsZ